MSFLASIAKAAIPAVAGLFGASKSADANKDFQKKFAKNAIQWKTQDALKAGIHPLFALGAPTMSPSSTVGDVGGAIADMGQDISRAIDVGGNEADRALHKLTLERAALENDKLRTEIAFNKSQIGPPSPVGSAALIPGQQQRSLNLKFMGQDIPLDPSTSNMEQFETRYGDEGPVAWSMPFGVLAADIKHNISRMTLPEIIRWIEAKTRVNPGQTFIPPGYSVSRGRYQPGRR